MSKMKDSGIKWIGEIPEHWEVLRHKDLMRKEKVICEKYNGEDIISLTMKGVVKRDLDNPMGKMPTTFDGYQYVEAGNLLLCLFDIDVTPRCVGLIKDNGLTSPAYSQFVVLKGNYAPYYDYLLRMIDDNKAFLHLSKNLRSSLKEDDFGAISSIKPPLKEQEKIASFLDKKCEEIDNLISIQEQEIEQIYEYRYSFINEVLKNGLDRNKEKFDTKIKSIGKIPVGWKFSKLNMITTCRDGERVPIDRDLRVSGEIPYWGAGSITDYVKDYLFDEELILLGEDGAPFFDITRPVAFLVNEKIWVNNHIHILKPKNIINPKYLVYFLNNVDYSQYINGSILNKLTQANMNKIFVVFPELAEQEKIVFYLDKKCEEIDNLIRRKKGKIDYLQEYKKSLIYECVTGKKEI